MTSRNLPGEWEPPGVEVGPATVAAPNESPAQANLSRPASQAIRRATRRQVLVEIERRSLGGLFMHLPAWLLLSGSSGLMRDQRELVVTVSIGFIVNLILRIVLHLNFTRLMAWRFGVARALFLFLLLSGLSLWGALGAASLVWPPLEPAHMLIQLISMVICAAGTMALALTRSVRFGMPLVLLAPYLATALWNFSVPHLYLALMGLLFLGYVLLVSSSAQRDYWAAVNANVMLAQRARELEDLSITDVLTQLRNRRFFDDSITREWARAQRLGTALTVMIVDLDHFKRINDSQGHPFGDVCLQAAAQAMSRIRLRAVDVLARYGGEEFVLLLPDTELAGGLIVAERLRHDIAALALSHGDVAVPLTCSIGVASARPRAGAGWAGLIAQTDAALYGAKEGGRNRVAGTAAA